MDIDEWVEERETAPLKRCAETPFGIYYISDQFECDFYYGSDYDSDYEFWEAIPYQLFAEDYQLMTNDDTHAGIRSFTPYIQKTAEGEAVKTLGFSNEVYCYTNKLHVDSNEAVATMCALFDQPIDYREGAVVLSDDE